MRRDEPRKPEYFKCGDFENGRDSSWWFGKVNLRGRGEWGQAGQSEGPRLLRALGRVGAGPRGRLAVDVGARGLLGAVGRVGLGAGVALPVPPAGLPVGLDVVVALHDAPRPEPDLSQVEEEPPSEESPNLKIATARGLTAAAVIGKKL